MGGPFASQIPPIPAREERFMNPKTFLAIGLLVMVGAWVAVDLHDAQAGEVIPAPGYKVLEPDRRVHDSR